MADVTKKPDHLMRVTYRADESGATYLYSGHCSCGVNVGFETTERKHVTDVLYEHAMDVARHTVEANQIGFGKE